MINLLESKGSFGSPDPVGGKESDTSVKFSTALNPTTGCDVTISLIEKGGQGMLLFSDRANAAEVSLALRTRIPP
jgi:hypothetical protein